MLNEKDKSPLTRKTWGLLFLLGLSAYAIGNGAMFWSLKYLPATTVSFLMGTLTITTLIVGIFLLKEIPSKLQIGGILVTLLGTALFFAKGIQVGETLGLLIFGVGVIGFTTFGILGRKIAQIGKVGTLRLTTIPLALGGGVTLIIAFLAEGLPSAPPKTWGLILFLAIVNTAIGYTLYNHALQALNAFQMNIVLNLTPLWTAFFGFFLLGEKLEMLQALGIVVMISGVMLVQMKKKKILPKT